MNRKLLTVIILLVIGVCLFAGNQKLYDAFSPEYKDVVTLCRVSGVVGPSSATPITADELKMAIERIDVNKLDSYYKALLDSVNQELKSNDDFSFDYDLAISPQIFYSKDYEKIEQKEFFIPFNEQDPLVYFGLEFEYGDSAFFETSFELMNTSSIIDKSNDDKIIPGIPLSSFGFLIDYRNNSFNTILNNCSVPVYGETPSVARGAIGGRWMNVVIGRTRQQMGSSRTANLVVGDNYLFQEAMDFSFFAKPFTYSLNLTHFDTQDSKGIVEHTRYSGPKQQIRIMHRFDVALIDSFRVALNLGNIIYTDNPFDLRYLFPVFMSHNLYNYQEYPETTSAKHDEANNIIGIEFEYIPLPRLELHVQLVVDQFKTFIEQGSTYPNAIGGMIGASYLKSFEDFDVDFWAEAIYTSPVLYLNYKTTDGKIDYNYDWALGYWRRDTRGDLEWAGYKGGPGVIALTLGSDFDFYKKNIELKSNITIKLSNDRAFTDLLNLEITPINKKYLYLQWDNIVNWYYTEKVSIYGGLSMQGRWDLMNNTEFRFLPQCAFGVKWSI